MGFDIAVAYANTVDIGKRTEKLVHVQFDLEHGHGLFEFGIMATGTVNGFWNIFKNKIKINFVFLPQYISQIAVGRLANGPCRHLSRKKL